MRAVVATFLLLSACGEAASQDGTTNSVTDTHFGLEADQKLTVRELKDRGLVELDRFQAVGAHGPETTGLVPVIVLGPAATKQIFDPERQFTCVSQEGVSEDDFQCYRRASLVRAEPREPVR